MRETVQVGELTPVMPEPVYIFTGDRFVLERDEGEAEADYLLRQAEMDCRSAIRARDIMLMRGLQKRERAHATIAATAAAVAHLPAERRAYMEARLRRLTAALDWSTG